MQHQLKATPTTVHWGHHDATLKPALKANPGDTINIETISLPKGHTPLMNAISLNYLPCSLSKPRQDWGQS